MNLVFWIVWSASTILGADSYCLDGWTRRGDSCYLFEDLFLKTWQEADLYCRGFKGHLVIIISGEENTWLQHEIRERDPASLTQFWTAGNDIKTEGHWVWGQSSDSIQTKYLNHGESNSGSGNEDCIAFKTLQWNDESCSKHLPFICEMDIQTTYWKHGEPNNLLNLNEDCIGYQEFAWNDEPCHSRLPFICEKEDPQVTAIIG